MRELSDKLNDMDSYVIVVTALATTTLLVLLFLVRLPKKNSIDDQTLAMATIGRVAVGVAHDMNNLLTIIGGHAEMFVGSKASENAAETIVEACECAGRLTHQILSLAIPGQSGNQYLDATNQIQSVENILNVLGGKGMEIRYSIPSLPIFLRLSASQLDQVLINLIANSREAKATLVDVQLVEQPKPGHTSVRSENWVTLQIVDNGQGMSSVMKRRATDQFYTGNKDSGTGIGLNTVQRIVESAKGKLAIQSRSEGGLIVRIDLPAETADEL